MQSALLESDKCQFLCQWFGAEIYFLHIYSMMYYATINIQIFMVISTACITPPPPHPHLQPQNTRDPTPTSPAYHSLQAAMESLYMDIHTPLYRSLYLGLKRSRMQKGKFALFNNNASGAQ